MSWASEVKAALEQGLHTDNLEQIAEIARQATFHRSDNVPAFVIEQIARNLCIFWDCAPDSDKHTAAEGKLLPPLVATLEAVVKEAPDGEICAILSRAISAYHVVISG